MRAHFLATVSAICLCSGFASAQIIDSNGNLYSRHGGTLEKGIISSITGVVTTPSGTPVGDARVELHNQQTGATVISGYTNSGGLFEFDNVPAAPYEVVVSLGLAESRQQIAGGEMSTNLKIRLNTTNAQAAHADGKATVSIAEYKVPQKARDALHKAQTALEKGNNEEVGKQLAKSLAIFPDYAPALTLRAVLSLDEGKTDAAIQDFDHAIHADPNFALAYSGMAAALNGLQKYDDALRSADRAITLDPASWQSHFEMAKAYIGKKDYQNALQQLGRAQQLCSKDYAPLHLLRANAMLALKDYNNAATELQAFLTEAPNDPNSAAARKALEEVKAVTASAGNPAVSR